MEVLEEKIEEKIETVFKNKNYLLLFIGTIVSRFGDVIFNFAIGWYILDLTGLQTRASTFIAIGLITMTILQIPGGVIADKFNKVKMIYWMDFCSGITLVVSFFILRQQSDTNSIIITLYITSFLLNSFHAFFVPASSSLIPKIVKENQYQQAQSYSNMVMNFNNIIGLIFGPILYVILKADGIILINGISFILSGISEIFIKEKEEEEKGSVKIKTFIKTFFTDIKEGVSYIWKETGLIQLIILAVFLNFFLNPIFMIFPQYLFNQTLDVNPIYYGITQVVFSISAFISALILSIRKQPDHVYSYIRFGLIFNFMITCFMLGVFYIIVNDQISLLYFMFIYCTMMFIVGALLTIVNVPLNVVFMKKIDKNMFGRVISVFGTFIGLVNPLSIIIFGILVDELGLLYSLAFSVAGGVIGISYLLLNKQLRKI